MAKCTKRDVKVTTTVEGFTLELTKEEAITLACIFRHIGGSSLTSLRRYTDAMDEALIEEIGDVGYLDSTEINGAVEIKRAALYFKDDSIKSLRL